ncbi:MAG: SDR family oxidoreductase [bacterium]
MTTPSARNVLITGASSGIGAALAKQFGKNGDRVFALARTLGSMEDLRPFFQSPETHFFPYQCDLQQTTQVIKVASAILKNHGWVDILIHNAGVTYFKDFLDTSLEEYDHVFNTNLRAVFVLTQAILPAMIERKAGTIVNIASYAAKAVYAKSSVYTASKIAMEGMMNVLRSEVRGKGIHITNVFPGAVLTSIWHPKHQERFGHQMLMPDHVANIVFEITCQPPSVMAEEITIRPQGGDLS